jgi:hypothetical protein
MLLREFEKPRIFLVSAALKQPAIDKLWKKVIVLNMALGKTPLSLPAVYYLIFNRRGSFVSCSVLGMPGIPSYGVINGANFGPFRNSSFPTTTHLPFKARAKYL